MLNKKSDILIKALIGLLVAASIIYGFYNAAEAYGKMDVFFKDAAAKDIALTLDSLHSIPGDITYDYPTDLKGYGLKIESNEVVVFKTDYGLRDVTAGKYLFSGYKNGIVKSFQQDNLHKIRFEKTENSISVTSITEEKDNKK